jgi:hypothetical protein
MWDNFAPSSATRGNLIMRHRVTTLCFLYLAAIFGLLIALPAAHAQDGIMGQIKFIQANKVAKTSGVWVDGQYIGYLGELEGRNRLRLFLESTKSSFGKQVMTISARGSSSNREKYWTFVQRWRRIHASSTLTRRRAPK